MSNSSRSPETIGLLKPANPRSPIYCTCKSYFLSFSFVRFFSNWAHESHEYSTGFRDTTRPFGTLGCVSTWIDLIQSLKRWRWYRYHRPKQHGAVHPTMMDTGTGGRRILPGNGRDVSRRVSYRGWRFRHHPLSPTFNHYGIHYHEYPPHAVGSVLFIGAFPTEDMSITCPRYTPHPPHPLASFFLFFFGC